MSICPRPDKTTKTNLGGPTNGGPAPAKKEVNPPQQRTEACGPASSTVIEGGGPGSTTEVFVPVAGATGPAGPQGPAGVKGRDGLGFFWRGDWGTGASYEKQDNTSDTKRLSDVVYKNRSSYICIQDHVADAMNEPQEEDFVGPTTWTDYWHLLAKHGDDATAEEAKTFLEDIFDWFKNASVDDIIEALALGAGIVLAGAAIIDMMSDDGTGDGNSDSQHPGTPGTPTNPPGTPTVPDDPDNEYPGGKTPPEGSKPVVTPKPDGSTDYTYTIPGGGKVTVNSTAGCAQTISASNMPAGTTSAVTTPSAGVTRTTYTRPSPLTPIIIEQRPGNVAWFKYTDSAGVVAEILHRANCSIQKTFRYPDGTVIVDDKNPDGSGTTVITDPGGKIITIITDANGNITGTWEDPANGIGPTPLYFKPTLKSVVYYLCQYAGINADVSRLGLKACEFVVGNQTAVRSVIEQLSLAYLFDMVDTGGVLKFVPRAATPVKTLTSTDIGFSSSDTPPAPYTARRMQGIDLPRSVTVKYFSEGLDYNTFTQTSQIFTEKDKDGQDIQLAVPFTMSDKQAKTVAETTMINARLERQNYQFTTSYKHIDLEPGDVIDTDMGLVRLMKIVEADEGLIQIDAVDAGSELAIEDSASVVPIPPASSNVPVEIGYSQGWFLDPNALNDQDKNVRIYVAVHGYNKPGWPGAKIYMSENGGASYDEVGSTVRSSTIGLVASVTPNADWHVWDTTTTISVQLKTGSLSSVSELDVLNGVNWCQIGSEIIGFKNAVLTAPMTYTLSHLLRGRRGTEQTVAAHVANELFVLLDDAVVKIEYPDADRNTTKKYKIVTNGSSLDKVDAVDVQMFSRNTLMWPVYNGKVLKVGSDFQVSWKERVRFDNQLKDYATTNHDADWAGYGIQVMSGSTVKNSYTTTSDLWTYSEAMQIQDFGSAQSSLTVKVVQMSSKWGSGYPVTLNS